MFGGHCIEHKHNYLTVLYANDKINGWAICKFTKNITFQVTTYYLL